MNIIINNSGIVNLNFNFQNEKTIKKCEKNKKENFKFLQVLNASLVEREKLNQAESLEKCGNYLHFHSFLNKENTKKLIGANFCKNPLCPVCAWRKHIVNQKAIHNIIKNSKKYIYHLVLSVPNTHELTKENLRVLKKNAVAFLKDESGLSTNNYIMSLEICYNKETGFHPHLHIILELNRFIKVDKPYIREMAKLWRYYNEKFDFWKENENGNTFYITGVKNPLEASEELTKYILKPDSFDDVTINIINQLSDSVFNTRLISSGGTLKEKLKKEKENVKNDNKKEKELLYDNFPFIDIICKWINDKYEIELNL